MFKPKDSKQRIQHRLKISAGHLKKVMSMVENGDYCISILHQSQAVQKSLQEIDHLIMENHLKTCVSDAIKKGKDTETINEIMQVLKKKHI